jgi:hypothetical protein
MANLLGQNIGTNYKGILNLNTLNGNLSGTLQAVTDGDGNASPLKLSTTELRIDSGVTNRRLTFGSNGQMSFVNDNDFIIDYSTGSANIFRLAYSGTAVRLNSDAYQFANYASGTIYANLQSEGFAIGQGTTSASARLQVKGDGTNPIQIWESGAGTEVARMSNTGDFSTSRVILGAASYFQVSSNAINYLGGASSSTNAHLFQLGVSPFNATSGTQNFISTDVLFAAGAGSANFRPLNLAYTINNSGAQTGTATGIFLNATETALNGMGHNLINLMVDNSSKARISNVGTLNLSGNIFANGYIEIGASAAYYYSGRSYITSPSDGTLALFSNSGSTFGRLQLGGTTNAFPAIKRNGAAIDFRLADDSGFCAINVGGTTSSVEALTVKIGASYGALMYADGRFTTKGSGKFGDTNGYDLAVASAILQADSTTRGFLPPRMTTTQVNAITSPAEGLVVFNTTISHLCVYQSGAWVRMSHSPM